MRIKQLWALILVLTFFNSFAQQDINFEQAAFEFYKDSIKTDRNFKASLSSSISEDHSYMDIDCLEQFNFRINDTAAVAVMNYIPVKRLKNNDKRFSRSRRKNNIPNVFALTSLVLEKERILSAIVEEDENSYTTYIIELNDKGIIRKWCSDKIIK